jgi:uncharacterized protein YbaP (TraB family)
VDLSGQGRMKIGSLFLLLSVGLGLLGLRYWQRVSLADDSGGVPQQVGSVWRVVHPDFGGQLYVSGTIHLLRRSDWPLPKSYEVAYADSDELIFELPPGSSETGEVSQQMQVLGKLEAGVHLKEVIGEELWDRLGMWARERGLSADFFAGYRPWFVALTMTATEYAVLGADVERGVDQVYEKRGLKDGKAGSGLETVEFQLKLFAGMEPELQVEVLEQTLNEVARLEGEFDRMIQMWKAGEIDALSDVLNQELEKYPKLKESFLAGRNRAWIEPLMGVLKGGRRGMALVGAGHLGGADGLLKLLEAAGCRLEQVRGF